MEYNYGDIIEYIDGTLDSNFNMARKWAKNHNVSFTELMDRRNLPKRYFQIGEQYIPTEDDKKSQVRNIRNMLLIRYVDPYQLAIRWEELSDDDKTSIKGYRQYLLDYTEEENWWEHNPKTYNEWIQEINQ
jgi:hypothetical protein